MNSYVQNILAVVVLSLNRTVLYIWFGLNDPCCIYSVQIKYSLLEFY